MDAIGARKEVAVCNGSRQAPPWISLCLVSLDSPCGKETKTAQREECEEGVRVRTPPISQWESYWGRLQRIWFGANGCRNGEFRGRAEEEPWLCLAFREYIGGYIQEELS